MIKKLKKSTKNKKNNNYKKNIKIVVKGIKHLGKPLYGKFLSLMIKNHILNEEKEEFKD